MRTWAATRAAMIDGGEAATEALMLALDAARGAGRVTDETVRLPRYEVGIDSYRAAKILIEKHGEGAKAHAGQRLQELLDTGDEAGASAWTDILFAIGEMRRGPRPGETRN